MISKLLVANRGEIAVRGMRAAFEAGIRTVAVYTHADRGSEHRLKADEAYLIGDPDRPVAGYLDAQGLVDTAVRVGADAIYPGYGFLSESPDLARRCEAAGVTFVGPPAEVLVRTGDKVRARAAAEAADLPVLPASGPVRTGDEAVAAAHGIGFPLFVKAAAGGGGRGLRLVEELAGLGPAVTAAMREAEGAFGDPTIFLERAVASPRHIEVQVLADAHGDVVHLFERDCSVQRRHQKVMEIAPAPNLDPTVRERMTDAAVRFARAVDYRNAGTVEFLLGPAGDFVFIEMNPRIQVEHTITEEVTGVDLVRAQLAIAGGASLGELGIEQDGITCRGAAIQCRITTEDPDHDFRPETGTLQAYRAPGGAGIRLDAGSAYVGAEVSPYFDSLLVKLTSRGDDLAGAIRRADRALAEIRVRGITTNIPFLRALLAEPDLAAGRLSTRFIDERPHLTGRGLGRDRATRLLRYLVDVTVNRPHGPPPATTAPPVARLPELPPAAATRGWRDVLLADGPEGFASQLRDSPRLAVTDTTMRDAHQSILATRMRTYDMLAVAEHVSRLTPGLLSMEVWGGATYDAALRFLHEDPWDRLARLREAVPDLCLQMLLRGQNAVGYTTYPPALVAAFVAEAASTGIDVFRIFDAFNDVSRMRPAIDAVRRTGAVAEGAICYTSDLSDPAETLYTLDYYLRVAAELVAAGVHVLCIKDMAGLLRPPAASTLVGALRREFDLPVHLHTHDTAGGQLATYLAAVGAGVDAVDGAAGPLSGMTSQPSLGAIVAATDHTPHATGLDLRAIASLEPYWQAVRDLYAPFEMGLDAPSTAVYLHEIPGGQLSNLRQQATAMGLGDRFEEVGRLYAEVDDLLGGLIKVTPSSKVVGDLAIHLASTGTSVAELESDPEHHDLPSSVLGFLAGDIGEPPGGWREPFRSRALADRQVAPTSGELSDDDLAAVTGPRARATLNALLFPEAAHLQQDMVEAHGDLSVLATRDFLHGLVPGEEIEVRLEEGVRLLIELEAVTEPDERGRRTAYVRLNGQVRPVEVVDRSVGATVPERQRAAPDRPGEVGAPMAGVVAMWVDVGDEVSEGDRLATIEAMKMESAVSSPVAGTVDRLPVPSGTHVEAGDLLLTITPTGSSSPSP